MPNDTTLPKPNIPPSPQAPTQPVATVDPPTLTSSSISAPLSNLSAPKPLPTPPTPASSQQIQARPTPSVAVGGLDSQYPGGVPPQLNEQGQVTSTSIISKTRQAPTFDQPMAPPQSTLQKMQTQAGSSSTRANSGPGMSMGESLINPKAGAQGQQGQQVQGAQAVQVTSQQAIAPTQSSAEAMQAGLKGAGTTHPSIGMNIPRGATVLSDPSQAKNEKEDKDSSSSKKSKKSSKAKDESGGVIPAKTGGKIPKIVPFILAAIVIVGGIIYGIMQILGGGRDSATKSTSDSTTGDSNVPASAPAKSNVVLSYWGLWEPESIFQEVLKDFEKETGISVDYRQQSHKDYRTRLQSAISSGSGPDLFRFHGSWVPMLKNELAPLPSKVMSMAEYEQTFYPVFSQQLQSNSQLVGMPLMYDGLALYYNKDILQTANEEVPTTWGEVRTLAEKLTVRSGNEIERGGIALGNTGNVEHYADILGLLIFQNGGDPTNPISSEVRDAIKFYASFGKTNPVFSEKLPSSTVAFAREEVAMMLAPSWRVHEVKHLNPELNFDIAPVPKLGESEFGWASFWAEGVSKKSTHQDEAWQLLKYLSSKEVLRKLYSAQSQLRAFGEIYPRKDMASELTGEYVSAYLQDASQAKSWALCSFTHDSGLNDQLIDYYKDAINSAVTGELNDKDLQTLSQGVNQVLGQFK